MIWKLLLAVVIGYALCLASIAFLVVALKINWNYYRWAARRQIVCAWAWFTKSDHHIVG